MVKNRIKLSICVIAYNEERFLPGLLKNIKEQTYPHQFIEVVLVDGMSIDKTKELMKEFSEDNKDFYSIQVVDNLKRNQAAGWNAAITHATGDVISRIDAHAALPKEFSALVVRDILEGEDIVGGIRQCIIERDSAYGRMLLAVENSAFGSSINRSRRSREKSYVKTMFHASYRKEVFQRAGLFNESLLRTEDNEMHYRIRKTGYQLCYDPEIISYQYARSSLKHMLKQKFENGYWIGRTLKVCPGCISIYHLVPMAFVCGIVLTGILARIGIGQLGIIMWALYGAFAIVNTIISGVNEGFTIYSLLMPFLFLLIHINYGIGTIFGVVRSFFL